MSQYIARWADGFQVVWRNLTKSEYQQFKRRWDMSSFIEPMDIALDIYKLVHLEGPDPAFVPAGIPAYICKQQMIGNPFSGRFEDIAPAVEMARRVVTGDYLQAASALIASTLNYRVEEIESWDPNKFFIRLAQTEIANGRTFDPVDPNAPKDKSGRVIQKVPKKQVSAAQQIAMDRTKQRDRGA